MRFVIIYITIIGDHFNNSCLNRFCILGDGSRISEHGLCVANKGNTCECQKQCNVYIEGYIIRREGDFALWLIQDIYLYGINVVAVVARRTRRT